MTKKSEKSRERMRLALEKLLNDFVDSVESIYVALPLVTKPLADRGKILHDEILARLTKNGVKNSGKGTRVPRKEAWQVATRTAELTRISKAYESVPQSLFIMLVSHADILFQEIARTSYRAIPEMLKSSDKKLSVSEAIAYSSVEQLREHLVSREVDFILSEGRLRFLDWLKDKLNIELKVPKSVRDVYAEATERRNLFVHSDGIVSRAYLDACKRHGIQVQKGLKLGARVTMDPKYFAVAWSAVYIIGVQTIHLVRRKFEKDPKGVAGVDGELLNLTAELLTKGYNMVAFTLAEFGAKLDNVPNKLHRMFVINHALTAQFAHEPKLAEKILAAEDWSGTDQEFQLALAVIRKKYTEAVAIMSAIGATADMEEAYREWPLFKEFRSDPLFNSTIQRLYGDSVMIDEEEIPPAPAEGN